MKYEHIRHICDKFPLLYGKNNNMWLGKYEKLHAKDLIIRRGADKYFIGDKLNEYHFIFGYISTKELAEEILQYIKDTEILFI